MRYRIRKVDKITFIYKIKSVWELHCFCKLTDLNYSIKYIHIHTNIDFKIFRN